MIPNPLLETIRQKQCIPIIGAGFSLNAKLETGTMPTWKDLTQKLAEIMQINEKDPLMVSQKFQDKSDRPTLISTIEKLLHKDKVKPHHVHRHFVKIPFFDIICTTNYDNLLEEACKQEGKTAKVIVEKQQISMYGSSQDLKILKIHGDLDHTQELIVTKDDYSRYSEKKKEFVIFLSSLLMTKTPLFIGFSLQDPNFEQIKKNIDSIMGESIRKGYVILFDPTNEEIKAYENMKLQVISIKTNGKTKADCLLELFETIHKEPKAEKFSTISVSTNKTILFKNQTLKIRTLLGHNPTERISIIIKNDQNDILLSTNMDNAKLIKEGLLEKELILNEEKWNEENEYTVFAEWNGQKVSDSFIISKPPEIIVQTDKSVYIYGNDIILSAIVPQANIGSKINYKILNKSNNIIEKGEIPIKKEDTGIFQTIIKVKGDEWKYRGEEFNVIIQYGEKSAKVPIYTSNFGATIELDQKVYSWTDKVYITIVAPDFAQNQNEIDTIGNEEDGLISIRTSLGEITKYKLIETGKDTGIFSGEITLTGFVGKYIKNKSLRRYPFGITRGHGPKNGLIACSNEDTISILFQFANDEVVIGSANIRWNIGEIQWEEANYHHGDYAVIRVIDPDMNLSPDEIDVFNIQVWSDSDTKGIKIPIYETGRATGIFEGVVSLGNESTNEGLLKTKENDTIYAKYEDMTLPSPYNSTDRLEISATAKIVPSKAKNIPTTERITIETITITDMQGNILDTILEGQPIVIKIKLNNNQENMQPYVTILQIRDSNKIVIDTLAKNAEIKNGEIHEIGFMLRPLYAGNYNIEIFVWPSISYPEVLCKPKKTKITVKKNY